MLDLAGSQAGAAQQAGAAHHEAGRLHLDALAGARADLRVKTERDRAWNRGGGGTRPGDEDKYAGGLRHPDLG